MAVTLKRYDACLMPVEPAAGLDPHRLAAGAAGLATPILVLVDGMKASAIEDLLALGAADFISEPVCLEGLRVRLRHQLLSAAWGLAAASLEEPALRYGAQGQAVLAPVGLPPHRPGAMPAPGRGRESGPEAGGSPPAATRPRVASALFDQAVASLRLLPRWQDGGEPFAGQGTRGGRVRARVPAARTLPSRRQRGAGRQGVQQAPPRILGVDAQARHRSRALSHRGGPARPGHAVGLSAARAGRQAPARPRSFSPLASEQARLGPRAAFCQPGEVNSRLPIKEDSRVCFRPEERCVLALALARARALYPDLADAPGGPLPEYNETRARAGSFMGLAQNPDYAAEVTLQPLARFDLDAAILFSDILTVPHAMGLGLDFAAGEGAALRASRAHRGRRAPRSRARHGQAALCL